MMNTGAAQNIKTYIHPKDFIEAINRGRLKYSMFSVDELKRVSPIESGNIVTIIKTYDTGQRVAKNFFVAFDGRVIVLE